jgi:lipopolysaccharide transport system ATP-binding protein
MSDNSVGSVIFDGVSKRYRLGTAGTLRGTLSALLQGERKRDDLHDLWALKDVSFLVEPGEALGLIGPNGAGKTTTLKLLSNITRPTSGRVSVSGRVSSLIELGAGFHPELTGRENIYLNGAILGLRRREISARLEKIIAFSELERFIDTPVKRYSSGMYVRLGFAVAAHVEPDVLLVDEVLAVGDASFRHRCIQHMQELREEGTTVIFVSHNMHLVQRMCKSAVLLVNGQIHTRDDTPAVISAYENWRSTTPAPKAGQTASYDSQGGLILKDVRLEQSGSSGQNNGIDSHRPLKMLIDYRAIQPQQIGRIDIRILRADGTLCCTADSSQSMLTELDSLDGKGTIEVTYMPAQLTTGTYTAVIQVTDVSDGVVIASAKTLPFQVHARGAGSDRGIYVPQITWEKRQTEA